MFLFYPMFFFYKKLEFECNRKEKKNIVGILFYFFLFWVSLWSLFFLYQYIIFENVYKKIIYYWEQ